MRTRPRRWMRATNFGLIVDEIARLDPERTALIAGERVLRYGELAERAGRLATALADIGVGRGSLVALATGNDWRFVEGLLGTLRAGSAALLVNIKLGADTLRYVARHSEAKAVVLDPGLGERAEALASEVPLVLELGESYERELAAAEPRADAAPVEADDLALLMYTSGSTGRPKGVMLSHSSTWWQARSGALAMLHDDGDCGLVQGPLYHANALWGTLFPMLHEGGRVVVLPEFSPRAALEAIHQHRVTFTSGTPSMYSLLLADPELERFHVSSIELLGCGSAPVPEELMLRITEHFHCELCETYGLTEGGANILSPRWGVKKLGSTGLPVPDVEVRVVDVADPERDCDPGEVGELWTRSPANALGYLKDRETTAARFLPGGWLRTGDLFRRDEQGYCYFCGRTDDMISVGGENVYPKEVETVVLQHPAVADVGVVPVVHAVKGHAPVAWVVLKDGAEATEDDIRSHFLANGPAYAHPRRVFFTEALPMSATNKLDREELARRAAELLPEGVGRR